LTQQLQISPKHVTSSEIHEKCFRSLFRFSSVFLPGPCVYDVHQTASVHSSVFLPFVFRDPVFLNMCPNGTDSGDPLITLPLYKILSRGFSAEVIYIYIYIYIYISAGPFRGHQAARRMFQSLFPSPSNHLNHKLTVKLSIHFSNFQSSSLQLSICQSGISFSAIWGLQICLL